jgi:hypothetical protein
MRSIFLTHFLIWLGKIIDQVLQAHNHFTQIDTLEEQRLSFVRLQGLQSTKIHKVKNVSRNIFQTVLNELGEKRTALPDDTSCSRLLLLTSAEVQAVVHFSFFVENGLFLLDLAQALFLRLISLKNQKINTESLRFNISITL